MKCLSAQNTFGVSGVKSIAAKSDIIEVTGDRFFKRKKTQNASTLLQVSVSPDIQVRFDSVIYTVFLA